MVEHDHDQTLNGDALDREIDALLQVEPSPEFVARVRARVEAQSIAPRTWLAGRWIAVAAAAVAVVIGIAVWTATVSRPAPQVTVGDRIPSVPPSRQTAEVRAVTAEPVTPDERRSPPQLLVSPAESAGLQSLLAAVSEGRFDSNVISADDASVNPPMPIVIEPITVAPLVTADLELGAQQ
jgi:hypothetical protein